MEINEDEIEYLEQVKEFHLYAEDSKKSDTVKKEVEKE